MQSVFVLPLAVWTLFAVVVISLALYRKMISRQEMKLAPGQLSRAHRLDRIDRWGKFLTVATLLYGVVIMLAFLVRILQSGDQLAG